MRISAACIVLSALLVGCQAGLLVRRESSGCTCGDNTYTSSDISEAIQAAEDGGASDYPHQYHDYEGFSFPSCSGTFYEYPLESGEAYDGGSPGADRVIYDSDGDFCACITHTGASSEDGFVECD
ncbi:ribonuclease T1 [Daedalea quercina L-15889]|uniref:Ribonuclease T1 n=1 Tax=Daedalea quercina L-15889 TaxID=1314783 RepID=A0A165UL70_9APHY|nr:ribonuclease T1 [Daedalea quercina L-15889]